MAVPYWTAFFLASCFLALWQFLRSRLTAGCPTERCLYVTGVMLGFVLLVMVGEQAQEMQLAHWLPKTEIPELVKVTPEWMGLWFSIFPTVETLGAQLLAGILVLGSYITAQPSRAATD